MSEGTNVITVKPLRKVLQRFNEDLGQYINNEERFKLGRVLTIIDAAIADPEQRKAIKDLVNNEWWSSSNRSMQPAPMDSPHSDLRGICLALGFELYEDSDLPPSPGSYPDTEAEYSKKKYDSVLTTN